MADNEQEKEIELYLEQVKIFKETTPEAAEQLLEAHEGNIVYIGRETCPYCRKFVRKLSPLAKEHHLEINYVHSQHPEYEEQVQALRDKYDVPTVPGLLYSSQTTDLTVICDSSLEPEEILEVVEAN